MSFILRYGKIFLVGGTAGIRILLEDIIMDALGWILTGLIIAGVIALIVKYCSFIAKQYKKEKGYKENYGATQNIWYKHIDGLPLVANCEIEFLVSDDKFVILKDNQDFVLRKEKITAMDTISGKEAKSADAGVVAGAYLFAGITGAALALMLATSTYLVISYSSGEENKSVVIDVSNNVLAANKIVKEYKKNNIGVHTSTEL